MAFYITGDKHRCFDEVEEFVGEEFTTLDDTLILVGDTGINDYGDERDIALKEKLSGLSINLFCVHGNNERRPELIGMKKGNRYGGTVYYEEEFPNIFYAVDGEVYDINGRKCLVIGGTYWPTKSESENVLVRITKNLDKINWKVDAVFSYTCPLQYVHGEPLDDFMNQDVTAVVTEEWLDGIEKNLDYEKWICGHWHRDERIKNMIFVHREIHELFRFPYDVS